MPWVSRGFELASLPPPVHDKLYASLDCSIDTMTSPVSGKPPPGKTLEAAIRTTLAKKVMVYYHLIDQKLALKSQPNGARSSASSALGITLRHSPDVTSVLSSFANNLPSVISIHGMTRSLGILGNCCHLLRLRSGAGNWWRTLSIISWSTLKISALLLPFTRNPCKAHKIIARQSQISLDSLTLSINALPHSVNHKSSILHLSVECQPKI